jgi:hypothetical protein
MVILKHERSEHDYNMIVKETGCEDGRENELWSLTLVPNLWVFLLYLVRFESIRKFILKLCRSYFLEALRK